MSAKKFILAMTNCLQLFSASPRRPYRNFFRKVLLSKTRPPKTGLFRSPWKHLGYQSNDIPLAVFKRELKHRLLFSTAFSKCIA